MRKSLVFCLAFALVAGGGSRLFAQDDEPPPSLDEPSDAPKKEDPKKEPPKAEPKKEPAKAPEGSEPAKADPGKAPSDSTAPSESKPAAGEAPKDKPAASEGPKKEAAPLGKAGGPLEGTRGEPREKDFLPFPDRWRIQFPDWQRYGPDWTGEVPYERSETYLNPYNQNVLKGDYPIYGNEIFMVMTLISDTLLEGRSFPIPSGTSTNRARSEAFFGRFDQLVFNQNFVTSLEIFKGDTAFRPKDWVIKFTPVYNINYIAARENNFVNPNPQANAERLDGHIGLQEALVEKHLINLSEYYDFLTLIVGIQPFNSDFRGFLFTDNNLGVRLQGNYFSNQVQWNFAWFHQLNKDVNSGLNKFQNRDQNVFVANLFIQDVLGLAGTTEKFFGYTSLFSYHCNLDQGGVYYDENDNLQRPAKIGAVSNARGELNRNQILVHYLGWGGDGHIGPVNITHMYYFAVGDESFNAIAGRRQNVLAHFFACELSVDFDWLRIKGAFLYSSGDKNPRDGVANGFSAILDNPFFMGAGFSYYNRQNIPLVPTGVQLKQRLSLINDLRSNKIVGQSNFVNPGTLIYNVGATAKVTPKIFVEANVNFVSLAEPEVIEYVELQNHIGRFLGVDYSLGVQFRPLLTENIILTAGAAIFQPGEAFQNIYSQNTRYLYSTFLSVTLTY